MSKDLSKVLEGVRTIDETNGTLYCASDVAKALGYSNPSAALKDHCRGVLKRNVATKGGNQSINFIEEADVLRLIDHSRLPNAISFKVKWFGESADPFSVTKDMMVFDNNEFGKIRTILRDGEPWFAAVDVCRALTIANTSDAMDSIDEGDRMTIGNNDGALYPSPMNFINEAGLYTLVFQSRKPSAKVFRRWVTHDVLPSIRKHGMYATDALLNDPDLLEAQAKKLRTEREQKLNEENGRLLDENKRLAAMATSYETKLFIRDHIKDIFDFINKCVRSYAAISKGGKIGYGWKDYYDQLTEELGVDIRERGKPYIDQITDEEMGAAIRVAGKISVRPVDDIVSDELIELMKDIVRRAA